MSRLRATNMLRGIFEAHQNGYLNDEQYIFMMGMANFPNDKLKKHDQAMLIREIHKSVISGFIPKETAIEWIRGLQNQPTVTEEEFEQAENEFRLKGAL